MTQARKTKRDTGLSPAEVLDWLRRHPDFVVKHPELLDGAVAPERELGDGVSDLQHAMIERLRTDLDLAQRRQDDLLATGRANLTSQSRIHECVIAALSATSLEQLIQTVTTDFAVLLDLDVVALGIEPTADLPAQATHGLQSLPVGTVARLLGERAVSLRSAVEGEVEIYGGGAPLVASDALARIALASAPGLIAFGSRQPGKFEAGQAVELLSFLAQCLERVLARWLSRP